MLPNSPDPFRPESSLSDKHTIETPEQMSLDFAVAGIGSRFMAVAIDTIIQVIIVLVVFTTVVVVGITRLFTGGSVWAVAFLIAVIFLLNFGYFALFEVIWNGQTPGKRVVGLRVVKESGRPLTAAETIGRNLLRIVDQLPAFYAIGMAVALMNSQNKRLGDFVAGSIVVRESSLADMKPVWDPRPSAVQAAQTGLGGAQLSVEDVTLIEAFLNRRYDMDPDLRAQLAEQIFQRVKAKVGFEPDPARSIETMLETLVYERRSAGRA